MEKCDMCKFCLYAKAPYNDFVCHNQKSKLFGKVLEYGGRVEACEYFNRLNGTRMSIVEASELSLKSKGSFYFYKLPEYEDRNDVMMAMRFESNEDLIDFKEALLRLNLIYFDNNKDEKEKCETETQEEKLVPNVYYRIYKNRWNKDLTYEQNRNNRCNLPPENLPVIIYDAEKHNYFIGRMSSNNYGELVMTDSSGHIRIGLNDCTYWTSFEFIEYIEDEENNV